jgi:hypothetical protein
LHFKSGFTFYLQHPSNNSESGSSMSGGGGGRRKTLGGLIVSAVQNRSAHLRRAGSATNLAPSVGTGGGGGLSSPTSTRSLPPSPKASPTVSRKVSRVV